MYSSDFGPFNGKIWLNAAHQGPLPKVAVKAAHEAVEWKRTPFEMTTERFSGVPDRLRGVLARLVGAPSEEIILANSSSYGLHLLATGIPWKAGDEILLVEGDFPSTILPWLALEKQGVSVRMIRPRGAVLDVGDLEAQTTSATRLLCTTWVHSFTGQVVDEQAIGVFCRDRGVSFVLNCSQGIGAIPFDVSRTPVDAITSVGFKRLCGPYGTGFCWMRSDLLDALEYNQAYWLSMQTADDLQSDSAPVVKTGLGGRKYDVFGTANFFNFKPLTASVEYLLECGIDKIARYDIRLIERLVAGLDRKHYVIVGPGNGIGRAPIVFISHRQEARNRAIYEGLTAAGIHVALRKGQLRLSPHLYNTVADIDSVIQVLDELGR
jgi:selenocysteine lyase/cysteine desulfurase